MEPFPGAIGGSAITAEWPHYDIVYIALARAFIPRAKALAERVGAHWPASYEQASVGFFERMLGVDLDLV